MKQLSSSRGWEYAYRKKLDDQLANHREALEGADLEAFKYLQGRIRGIRDAIGLLDETRAEFRVDDDADFRE